MCPSAYTSFEPSFSWCVHFITELDEEECEKRREECIDDMADLERQFQQLKEQ